MEAWKADGNPGCEKLQFFGEKTTDGWGVGNKI
jgi:hypothetical protein